METCLSLHSSRQGQKPTEPDQQQLLHLSCPKLLNALGQKAAKGIRIIGPRAATSCPFRNRAMRMARARHHCHRCSPPCSSNKKTWALSTPPQSFPSLHCSLKSFRLICSEPRLRVFSSGERCGSTQDGHPAISLLRFGG